MTVNTWLRITSWSTAVVGGTLLVSTNGVLAQVIPDNTLGTESSIVTPLDLTTQRIDGGAARGSNLFHSFLEFGIPEDTGVYFADPDSISTIFSRVTGENPSEIYGTLGVLGDANLFLLNPNGVLFGPDAELDMEGSFVGSTANSLMLSDGAEFSATNPAALPMLDIQVEAPVGLVFEGADPGVIVNAANLAVGENLLLAGGTIVSPGELTALTGEVAVVTAVGDGMPGRVELTQAGELVGLESEPVGTSVSPEQLLVPQWSALAGLSTEDEQLQVGNSGLAVVTGDVVVRQVTADTATLSAANDLTLAESQLVTQGDLELLAQDTLQVRDSDLLPVIIAAADDLLVQGNESVDIFALNHSSSGLASGGDMVLRSADAVGGDAHYWTGSNFRIERLDGELGSLFSPYDPIIRSQGDVSFFAYQGASLHILAGGAVDANTIVIIGPDAVGDSINPISTPGLASVTLTDNTQLTIDGNSQPTLDIRAGVDPAVIGEPLGTNGFNFPDDFFLNPNFLVMSPPENNTAASSANITLGEIFVEALDGLVFLTNQYEPNISLLDGNITITGDGAIGIEGIRNRANNGAGNSGDVIIDSRNGLEVFGNISTSSFNETGNAGNIKLLASETITFDDFSIIAANVEGSGQGGDVFIKGEEIQVRGGSQIFALSRGDGPGGDMTLDARGDISIFGASPDGQFLSGVFTEAQGTGPAGNVLVNARNLLIRDSSQISAGSSSEGRGSSLTVNATESVQLIGSGGNTRTGNIGGSGLYSQSEATGPAGTLTINTQQLLLKDGAQISSASLGTGAGGDLVINANELVIIEGTSSPAGLFSRISSQSEVAGIAGNMTINTQQLIVRDGGQISTTASGTGISGTLYLDIEDSIQLTGLGSDNLGSVSSGLFSATTGTGAAGAVNVLTRNLTISDGAIISASTDNVGNGGTITISASESILLEDDIRDSIKGGIATTTSSTGNAGNVRIDTRDLIILDGTEIQTGTSGLGNGGNIVITAEEAIQIIGVGDNGNDISRLDSQTSSGGLAGNISIATDQLLLQDGGQVTTLSSGTGKGGDLSINSQGGIIITGISESGQPSGLFTVAQDIGDAGNLRVEAQNLNLQDGAFIATAALKSDGGNIIFSIQDVMLLRNNSNISASSGVDLREGGNGGNIAVTANFIIAVPEENSDITANAFAGNGGNVTIKTQGLFGIEFRAETTSLSDITASSEVGLDGNVNVDTLETDPTGALENLPEETANTRIQESCQANNGQASVSFFDVGRSGAPTTPEDLLGVNPITENWTTLEENTVQVVYESETTSRADVNDLSDQETSDQSELQLITSCLSDQQ